MAKKDKKNRDENEKEKGGGGTIVAVVVVFLIILLWVAIFAILVKLDVVGLGTMLRPTLKDVPVISSILPAVPEEQISWENDYPYTKMSQAIDRIKELEAEVAALKEEKPVYENTISELRAEVDRLKVFEDDVSNFEKRVKEFDYMVVFNSKAPSITEYKKFYEEINPETAENIYRLVLERLQFDEGVKKQAEWLKTMKAGNAAAVLEESTADIGWIVKVLEAMKTNEAAAILNKMDNLYAAKIMKKMSDMKLEEIENIMNEIDSNMSN